MSGYTIIRNIRGGWPNWLADLDNWQTVYIRIRSGDVSVGLGKSIKECMESATVVKSAEKFCGVTDCVDALVELRELGYYYAAPAENRLKYG